MSLLYFPPGYLPAGYFAAGYFPGGPGAAPAPAADLDEAIWARLEGDAALRALAGRPGWLWIGEAPPGAPLPHGVIVVEEPGDDDFVIGGGPGTADALAEVPRQVNLFGDAATARALMARAARLLDPAGDGAAPLLFAGGAEVARWPERPAMLELDPDRGPDGSDVWCGRLFYAIEVARTLGA